MLRSAPSRLMLVLIVSLVGGVPGCSPGRRERADVIGQPVCPATRDAPGATAAGHEIRGVLTRWSGGEQEAALQTLLDMSGRRAPLASFRTFNMPEPQFTALPLAERDRLRAEMLAELKTLRELSRELHARAKRAVSTADFGAAQQLFEAEQHVGAANCGPDVPDLVALVGCAIQQRADTGLAELNRARHNGHQPN